MKKLVHVSLGNKIYWATVNEKTHTMNTNTKIDVTDDAVNCVFEHFIRLQDFKEKGFSGYAIQNKEKTQETIFCTYKTDEHITISRELYNELVEYKNMYEGLED